MIDLKTKRAGASVLALAILMGLFIHSTKRAVSGASVNENALENAPTTRSDRETSTTFDGSRDPASVAPVSTANAVTPHAVAAQSAPTLLTSTQMQALNLYHKIRRKVFLSDSEKLEKAGLMKNSEFLLALLPALRSPALSDTESQSAQMSAIDLLLDARKDLHSEAAGTVLRSLIEDSAVESVKLAPAQRESLAGLKAEVLYQWSAQEPALAPDMARWLPGPVSAKIWRNVLEVQEQNVSESHAAYPDKTISD